MEAEPSRNGDVVRRRALLQRLEQANVRVHALEDDVQGAGDVVRLRMTRHVQFVTEILVDVNARCIDMPAAHTDERPRLEHDLRSLEAEIAVVEAKYEAARAEENAYLRPGPPAELRAFRADVRALRSEPHGSRRA